MPTIPGPFPLTGTFFPSWQFQGSAIGGLTVSNQAMADRIAQGRNVLDYGVAGDGTTDDSSALTACFAQKGFWYMPRLSYHVANPILLPNGSPPNQWTGEDLYVFGPGASISAGTAGIADFLIKRDRGSDYFGPKVIDGLVLSNNNAAGGLIYAYNCSQLRIQNCVGDMTDAGSSLPIPTFGFMCAGSNGSYQVVNCTMVGAGTSPNQVAIAVPSGLGSLVEACNLHGVPGRGIMMGGGGGAGGRMGCNRLEVCNVGMLAGWGGDYQMTTGTSTASGSHTVLPVSSALLFRVGDTVFVKGSAASGATVAAVTATSIELATGSFVSVPSGTWISLSTVGGLSTNSNSGAGVHIESNSGEGNFIPIYLMGSKAAVVHGNTFQMYNGGAGQYVSKGGVAFGDGVGSSVIEANSLTGVCSDSVYFYNGVFGDAGGLTVPVLSTAFPDANTGNSGQVVIQNNEGGFAGGVELCMVQNAVTNSGHTAPMQLFSIPRWLDHAINVAGTTVWISSTHCTIASTTIVTAANTSNNQMTLSADISGTQPANQGFQFWTGSQFGTLLGYISVV